MLTRGIREKLVASSVYSLHCSRDFGAIIKKAIITRIRFRVLIFHCLLLRICMLRKKYFWEPSLYATFNSFKTTLMAINQYYPCFSLVIFIKILFFLNNHISKCISVWFTLTVSFGKRQDFRIYESMRIFSTWPVPRLVKSHVSSNSTGWGISHELN